MTKDTVKLINKFYGGIARDDKAKIPGSASNMEEIDIFTNADYFQAEQILIADALPATTEAYAYCAGSDDTVYAYGKETAASKVRILSVATGGADNPGAFTTLFTSADATNLAYSVSPISYFKTTEAAPNYLYYCTIATATIVLKRLKLSDNSESTVGTLTGLDGSFDRIIMKEIFGELIITNGNFMAKVDQDGVFTNAAFTLPKEWEAVDIIAVSDVSLILARNINRLANYSKGYWWDLTQSTQVDDSFNIPMGGPQWIINHQETIKFMCAINGIARFFQLSGAFPGAVPLEIPGISLTNIGTETATQPISPAKGVGTKDRILYFMLFKTDKSGLYAIGKLDSDKPNALVLAKRFHTTDYSAHKPTGFLVHGPNFYLAFIDNTTASTMRCESNNSPTRSSNAVYETVVIDNGDPSSNKTMKNVYVVTKPLDASTSVSVSVAGDYGSYTTFTRPDGTAMNTTSAVLGAFDTKSQKAKSHKIKVALTSSTVYSPKVTGIAFRIGIEDTAAPK